MNKSSESSFLLRMFADPFQSRAWQPTMDVYRTRTGWLLKFELAGVRLDDVKLELSQRTVKLSGARRDLVCGESCVHHAMEIAYSHFERSVELPCDLTKARISSQISEGMLLVEIVTS
ncbi:MAG TPA: Hsp20/alpha crystallin family protein [Planctomycetota bacterium]|nr:Hsp20/alpha crystallin family protein [Planctomycetota bacterium]